MFGDAKLVMRGGFGMFYDIERWRAKSSVWGLRRSQVSCKHLQHGAHLISGYNRDPIADPFTPFGATNVFPFSPRTVGPSASAKIFLTDTQPTRTSALLILKTSTTDSNGRPPKTPWWKPSTSGAWVAGSSRQPRQTTPFLRLRSTSWHSMDSSMKIARVR